MKRRDLERHLREQGCQFIGEGSKHAKWRGRPGTRASIDRCTVAAEVDA